MQPKVVQAVANFNIGSSEISIELDAPCQLGNLIVVFVGHIAASKNFGNFSCHDTLGNSFSQIAIQDNSPNPDKTFTESQVALEIYFAPITKPGANIILANDSNIESGLLIHVAEVQGLDPTIVSNTSPFHSGAQINITLSLGTVVNWFFQVTFDAMNRFNFHHTTAPFDIIDPLNIVYNPGLEIGDQGVDTRYDLNFGDSEASNTFNFQSLVGFNTLGITFIGPNVAELNESYDSVLNTVATAGPFGNPVVFPLTYSVIAGALPPGLVLDFSSGEISGTATQGGIFSFQIQVVDSSTYIATTLGYISVCNCGIDITNLYSYI